MSHPLRDLRVVRRTVAACMLIGIITAGFVVFLTGARPAAAASKTYNVVLDNSFIGNTFRVLMEKETVAATDYAPLKGRVNLRIVNTDGTVTGQIASLNQIIATRPNAILLDAASPTALNPVVQRACSAGITVVSFDESVTAPCNWQVDANATLIGQAWANWFMASLHGHGKIFEDLGIPGHGLSNAFDDALTAALKTHPGVTVECTFYSQYQLGPEQQGVSQCLGAHPKVDGVYALGYAAGAMTALKNAGVPQVPVTGGAYNVATTTCAKDKGVCLLAAYPAYIGALALKTAVSILDGANPKKSLITNFPFFQQGGAKTTVPGENVTPIKIGVNAFPNLPSGITIPYSVPWVKIPLSFINKQKI